MASRKPTAVIVPGAWHPPVAYASLTSTLAKAGFESSVAILPSFNSNDPLSADCRADATALRRQFLSILDEAGHDIVLLVHSYGVISTSGASCGLSKKSRERQEKKTGVLGMMYLSGFVVPEGQSLLEYLGVRHAPYVLRDSVRRIPCLCDGRTLLGQKQGRWFFVSPSKACPLASQPSKTRKGFFSMMFQPQ